MTIYRLFSFFRFLNFDPQEKFLTFLTQSNKNKNEFKKKNNFKKIKYAIFENRNKN